MSSLAEALSSTWVTAVALPALLLYGTAFLGALLMYFFAAAKGLEGTIPKLKQLLPNRSETFYYRVDFTIVIVVGPLVGIICFKPHDPFQALAAGCGWVAALNILIQQKPSPGNIEPPLAQPQTDKDGDSHG